MSTEDRDDKDPLQFLVPEILQAENRGQAIGRRGSSDQQSEIFFPLAYRLIERRRRRTK